MKRLISIITSALLISLWSSVSFADDRNKNIDKYIKLYNAIVSITLIHSNSILLTKYQPYFNGHTNL